jgi:hypothetical protein
MSSRPWVGTVITLRNNFYLSVSLLYWVSRKKVVIYWLRGSKGGTVQIVNQSASASSCYCYWMFSLSDFTDCKNKVFQVFVLRLVHTYKHCRKHCWQTVYKQVSFMFVNKYWVFLVSRVRFQVLTAASMKMTSGMLRIVVWFQRCLQWASLKVIFIVAVVITWNLTYDMTVGFNMSQYAYRLVGCSAMT